MKHLRHKAVAVAAAFLLAALFLLTGRVARVDVLVVGGGCSGVAAGIQASRMGASTMIVEPTPYLGGMLTSAGVSAIDGNYRLRGGIFAEFTDSLFAFYGGKDKVATGWVSNILFEPHVGAGILSRMASREENLTVVHGYRFAHCKKKGNGWVAVFLSQKGRPMEVRSKVLVDATELGDVAASAGIHFSVGFDSRERTGESIAPVKASLVVQDLTLCLVVKDYGEGEDRTIPEPEGYDSSIYFNCALGEKNHDFFEDSLGVRRKNGTLQAIRDVGMVLSYARLPSTSGDKKYLLNWPCEGNDTYVNMVEASYEQRLHMQDSARNISLGFLHYLQTEYGLRSLGLSDDEFDGTGIAFIPYHRESRRIEGKVLFTLDDISSPFRNNFYRTSIGVGDYPVDHHHYRNPIWRDLPKLDFYGVPSYSLPMGVMIPKGTPGLIVCEKSMSVTNLAYGTVRLQPVAMQAGQAAGALAALSLECGGIDKVPVRKVQQVLLDAGSYIMPYLDVPREDPLFGVLQRIGATGIMRGEGKAVAWSNETWFRVNDPVREDEVFLSDYLSGKTLQEAGLPEIDPSHPMTRGEYAALIDSILDPFHRFEVDLDGNVVR